MLVCVHSSISLSIPFLLSLALFISYMLFSPFLSLPPSLPCPLPCDSPTPLLAFPIVSKETGQNGSKSTLLFVTCFQTAQYIVGPLSVLAKLPVSPFPTWNGLWRTNVCVEVSETHESNIPKPAINLYGGANRCPLSTLPSCFHTQYRVNSCDLGFLTHIGICKLKINTKATFQNKMLIYVPSGIGERTRCL